MKLKKILLSTKPKIFYWKNSFQTTLYELNLFRTCFNLWIHIRKLSKISTSVYQISRCTDPLFYMWLLCVGISKNNQVFNNNKYNGVSHWPISDHGYYPRTHMEWAQNIMIFSIYVETYLLNAVLRQGICFHRGWESDIFPSRYLIRYCCPSCQNIFSIYFCVLYLKNTVEVKKFWTVF